MRLKQRMETVLDSAGQRTVVWIAPPSLVDFGFMNEIGDDTWNIDNNGSNLPLLMTKPFILLAAKFEFRRVRLSAGAKL